ncbi:MAG: uracil-DNA glycosylase [Bacteroidota bacterium]
MRRDSVEEALAALQREVIDCRRCARLVRWREEVARTKVRRFADEEYWGKPVPGFGDPAARLLLVGLAPAAHGGNRTGRMFTGDESGNWLFHALYRAGFASQAESLDRSDGLKLRDCYITATCRCAPPANKLLPAEIANCRPFILREIAVLTNVRVVIGLGRVGFSTAVDAYREAGRITLTKRPRFGHAARYDINGLTFIASFHPSQQNTFTGRLTRPMFDRIFTMARKAIER